MPPGLLRMAAQRMLIARVRVDTLASAQQAPDQVLGGDARLPDGSAHQAGASNEDAPAEQLGTSDEPSDAKPRWP